MIWHFSIADASKSLDVSLSQVTENLKGAEAKLRTHRQTRTSKQLGIGAATLYRKLKKYGQVARAQNA